MLRFINTSVLDSQAQTVVNTVNVVGVMGKGLAHEFKARHPEMFERYKGLCATGALTIGRLWLWRGPDQWVLNFPTKKHWRFPAKLEYIEAGLRKFVENYELRGIREISFPRLGCGNGGLDWNEVRPLMEQYLAPLPINIYIHDFEADIGAPEHKIADIGAKYRHSYDAFVSDLRILCAKTSGRFKTVDEQAMFDAVVLPEGCIRFDPKGVTSMTVPPNDLYEAWFMLQQGPLTETKLVGTAHVASKYLLGLLASLPYARAVEIGIGNEVRAVGVELAEQMRAEETITASS